MLRITTQLYLDDLFEEIAATLYNTRTHYLDAEAIMLCIKRTPHHCSSAIQTQQPPLGEL